MKSPHSRRNLGFAAFTAAVAGGILFAAYQQNHPSQQAVLPQTRIEAHLAADAPATAPAVSDSDKRNGITRVKTPDGGLLVTALNVPRTPRDPRGRADYVQGDWIVENLGSEPALITPFIEKDAYGVAVQEPVLESLLSRDPETFEWQPFLAESYEEKPDHVTFDFTIRKEAKFSDGTPVTPEDIVFSFNTVMEKDIDSDRMKSYYSRVEYCKKVGDRTIEFKFKEPYFEALEQAGGLYVIPEHVYKHGSADEYNKKSDLLLGSGPYVFKKENWLRGQKLTLERNPNYWGPKPTFNKEVFVFIQNPQAAFQAFQGGEIDSDNPNPEQWDKFSTNADFKANHTIYKFEQPNGGYQYIGWNEKKPMFADAKTRTAMTMLTDRDTMIDTVQRKLAHPITGPFSSMTPQNDGSIKPLPFDPRGAKKLLKDAGWTLNEQNILVRNGGEFRFDLMIPANSPQYQQIAEFIKTQYAKAGIIMTIAPFEFSVLVNRLDDRNYDASMLRWTGGIEEDPYQIWHSDSIKDKGSNYISWKNDKADELITAGRREMDEAKRMEIWHQLHKIIADEQPYTFLWISTRTIFIQPRFKNTEPYKTGVNSSDWYVPADQQKYKQ